MDPGNLPNHVVILTKNSQLLRTTLADRIEIVARTLNESFVVTDKQMKKILETAAQQPEDGVSVLISIIKDHQENFDKFIHCLWYLEYEGLVRKLQGTGSAAVGTTEEGTGSAAVGTIDKGTGSAAVGTTEKVPRIITDNTVPRPPISWPTPPKQPVQYEILSDTNCMNPCATNSRPDFSEPDYQVVKGKMDKNHLSIWRAEKSILCSEFEYDLPSIVRVLHDFRVIDVNDKLDIERESRTPEGDANGAKKLLEILENRGKNVLPRIIKALKAIKHEVGDYLQARINGSKKRKRGIVNTT